MPKNVLASQKKYLGIAGAIVVLAVALNLIGAEFAEDAGELSASSSKVTAEVAAIEGEAPIPEPESELGEDGPASTWGQNSWGSASSAAPSGTSSRTTRQARTQARDPFSARSRNSDPIAPPSIDSIKD